jgi:hypothetical protein
VLVNAASLVRYGNTFISRIFFRYLISIFFPSLFGLFTYTGWEYPFFSPIRGRECYVPPVTSVLHKSYCATYPHPSTAPLPAAASDYFDNIEDVLVAPNEILLIPYSRSIKTCLDARIVLYYYYHCCSELEFSGFKFDELARFVGTFGNGSDWARTCLRKMASTWSRYLKLVTVLLH